MAATDLTTPAAVQALLSTASTENPALMAALVSGVSGLFLKLIGRNILQQTYSAEVYDAPGTDRIFLKNNPVTAVSALLLYADTNTPISIPPAPNQNGYGYQFDDRLLYLIGGKFERGRRNVAVSYTAGYADGAVSNEQFTVSASASYQLAQATVLRALTSPAYVSGGSGNLTQVSANPALGQFTLSPSGVLGFNAAEAGHVLVASYATNGTPADLAYAATETAALKYRRRNNLQDKSQVLAQQNLMFDLSDIPATARLIVESYKQRLLL